MFLMSMSAGMPTLTAPATEQKAAIEQQGYMDVVSLIPKGKTNIVLGAVGVVADDVVVSSRVYKPVFRDYQSTDEVTYTDVNIYTALAALTFGAEETPTAEEMDERLAKIAEALGLDLETVKSNYNGADPAATTPMQARAVISDEVLLEYGIMPRSYEALKAIKDAPLNMDTLVVNLKRIKEIVDPIVEALTAEVMGSHSGNGSGNGSRSRLHGRYL